MARILGTIASGFVEGTSFESIATVTVGSGGAANVEFTSIPNTYTHLQIRGIGRMTDNTVTGAGLIVEFNSDTTDGNYKNHGIYGNGTSALAYDLGGEFGASYPIMSSTLANANVFGTTIFDILDYKNTNKYKTVRNLTGYDNNGSGTIRLTSGLWMSTSAITSIKLTPGAVTLTQYSHFALYGIKSA